MNSTKVKNIFLGEKLGSHMTEINTSQKEILKAFKDFAKSCPFEKSLCLVKTNYVVVDAITAQEQQLVETKINILDTKITAKGNSSNMEVQLRKVNTSLVNVKDLLLTNNQSWNH